MRLVVKPKVVSIRNARIGATRLYWRGLEKAFQDLPLALDAEADETSPLGGRDTSHGVVFPDFDTAIGRCRLVISHVTSEDLRPLPNSSFLALEKAICDLSARFETDENGWPVWRSLQTEAEFEDCRS